MFGKTNATLTERDVLDALKGVKDPDLGRDLVDLGMIKDIKIGDGAVALMVNLTTPACPLKAQIERDVRSALEAGFPASGRFTSRWGRRFEARESSKQVTLPASKTSLRSARGRGGSASQRWRRPSLTAYVPMERVLV